MDQDHPYVEERDGDYFVRGQRVPLRALAGPWNEGASPETIAQKFPVLTLAEVYGVIAYYIERKPPLDAHFARLRADEDATVAALDAANDAFRAELRRRFTALAAGDAASAS